MQVTPLTPSRSFAVAFATAGLLLIHMTSPAQEMSYSGQPSPESPIGEISAVHLSGSVTAGNGQHSEQFPLFSLPTKSQGIVDFSLAYSGAVSHIVRAENRDIQASPVGVGFSYPVTLIASDHNMTASRWDDTYTFITGGSGDPLVLDSVDASGKRCYRLASNPMSFLREIVAVYDTQLVVGWDLILEGTYHLRLGDSDTTNSNSVGKTLAWNDAIGIGWRSNSTDGYDIVVPTTWYLSWQTPLHTVRCTTLYTYEQDLSTLPLQSTDTSNHYTQFVYPKSITTSTGHSAVFYYSSREDTVTEHNGTGFEDQALKKLDSINVLRASNIIGRHRFAYGYHNSTYSSQLKKLRLERLSASGLDVSDSLAPYKFAYEEDTSFTYYGAIASITYPAGAVKRLKYGYIDGSDVLLSLNHQLDETPGPNYTQNSRPNCAFSRDVGIAVGSYVDTILFDTMDVAYLWSWNGFWDVRDLSAYGIDPLDSSITAGSDWVAFYQRDSNAIFIKTYNGGLWEDEPKLELPWNPLGEVLHLYSSRDCIVVVDKDKDDVLHIVYAFHRTDSSWMEFTVHDTTATFSAEFDELQFGTTVHCLQGRDISQNKHFYRWWSFDRSTATFTKQAHFNNDASNNDILQLTDVTIRVDGSENTHIADYNHETGLFDAGQHHWSVNFPNALAPLFPGYVAHTGMAFQIRMRPANGSSTWHTAHRAFSGTMCGPVYQAPTTFPISAEAFGVCVLGTACYQRNMRAYLQDHDSLAFHTLMIALDHEALWTAAGTRQCLAAWYADFNHTNESRLFVTRNSGTWNWSAQDTLLDFLIYDYRHWGTSIIEKKVPSISATKNLIAVHGKVCPNPSDSTLDYAQRYIFVYNSLAQKWDTLDVEPLFYERANRTHVSTCNGRAMIIPEDAFPHKFQRWHQQLYGSQITNIPVVQSVHLYTDGDTTSVPLCVIFDYRGVIFNSSTTTPRCAEVAVSSVHYEGNDPESWRVIRFYNDIDAAQFASSGLNLPNLVDSSLFNGIVNGGYLLDGSSYFAYDSASTDTAGHPFDYSETQHTILTMQSGMGKTLYHPTIARQLTQVDGVVTVVDHQYDDQMRSISSQTDLGQGRVSILNTYYKSWSDGYIGSHADSSLSMIVDTTSNDTLVTNFVGYTYLNRYQIDESYTWTDLQNRADSVALTRVVRRDEAGQPIETVSPSNQHTFVQYGSRSTAEHVAAAFTGVRFNLASWFNVDDGWRGEDWVHQDWISWDSVIGYHAGPYNSFTDDAVAFTGEKSVGCSASGTGLKGAFQTWAFDSTYFDRDYSLSFWAKSSVDLVIDWYAVHGGHTGSTIASFSKTVPGSSEWTQYKFYLPLKELDTADAFQVQIWLANGISDTANFDDFILMPIDASVETYMVDKYGRLVSSSGTSGTPTRREYDGLGRLTGTFRWNNDTISTYEYYSSRIENSGVYDRTDPNYTLTSTLRTDGVSKRATFFDGSGRTLQNRTLLAGESSSTAVLVTGLSNSNATGQVTRSYLPYIDHFGDTTLLSFDDSATARLEVDLYYDGSIAPNAGNRAYAESDYETGSKRRLIASSKPLPEFDISGAYARRLSYDQWIDGSDTFLVVHSFDEDSNHTSVASHVRGTETRMTSYFDDGSGIDSSIIRQLNRPMTRTDTVFMDTGSTYIPLRATFTNDLGLVDSTWKVDYGTIRMIYDDFGKLRFMQNDQRRGENSFVYFKYDSAGRKLEEGVMDSADVYFNGTTASLLDFPDGPRNPDIKYRWHFDFWTDGSDTLFEPGKLVRVESGNQLYYQNFEYFIQGDSDIVSTRLPHSAGIVTSVTHVYDHDGSLRRLTFRPTASSDVGIRHIEYDYDLAGNLRVIKQGGLSLHKLHYAEFDYNERGRILENRLGVMENIVWRFNDTLQIVNYDYDAAGALLGINSINGVASDPTKTYGDAYDHFAQEFTYYDTTISNGNFNGAPWIICTRTNTPSSGSTTSFHYTYQYDNGRGWLEKAVNTSSSADTREYSYNQLGQRTSTNHGSPAQLVDYHYDTSPGSSRLRWITGMGVDSIYYDTLGNMVSDLANDIYSMRYDYRNMLTHVTAISQLDSSVYDSLEFVYDQTRKRIHKKYYYHYMDDCEPDTIIFPPPMAGQGPGGGQQCPKETYANVYYLYDRGELLATFTAPGMVREFFVNGPIGKVATYYNNDDSLLFYSLFDYLGTPRVQLYGTPRTTPFDTSYYVSGQLHLYPFGATATSVQVSSYPSNYTFTGQERDDNGAHDYLYFGGRYYDAQLGQFTSIDKAGQFASGFAYGDNNPIIGTDPDGEFFHFLLGPALGALIGGLTSGATYALMAGGSFRWDSMWESMKLSAASGAIGATLSVAGNIAGVANNIGYRVISEGASYAAALEIQGQEPTLRGFGSSLIASTALSELPSLDARSGSTFRNTVDDIAYSGFLGAAHGGLTHVTSNAMAGRDIFAGIDRSFSAGLAAGASRGIATTAVLGPIMSPNRVQQAAIDYSKVSLDTDAEPTLRLMKFGLLGLVPGMPRGFAGLGSNILVTGGSTDWDETIDIEEIFHFYQLEVDGFGYAGGKLAEEQIGNQFGADSYNTPGKYEWEASYMAREFHRIVVPGSRWASTTYGPSVNDSHRKSLVPLDSHSQSWLRSFY